MDETAGLRERKKEATRLALHRAALRLATEEGLQGLHVEAIADAANVSRRTFSNYFPSKEAALFYDDAVRVRRMLELVRAQPADVAPWAALGRAAEQLTAEADGARDRAWLAQRRQLRGHPSLAAHQVAAYTTVERELAAEVERRLTGDDVELRARVLAATFLATVRAATQHWVEHPRSRLPHLLAVALRQAAPAGETAG